MKLVSKMISELNPAAYNPRNISPEAMNGLEKSIEKFGCVEPIVWNKRTGNIVGGHQRYEVLKKMGEEKTDVVVVDLSEQEEKQLNVSLNNPQIQGEFDQEKLQVILSELKDLPDFSDLRFDKIDFPVFEEGEAEESEEAEETEETVETGEANQKKWGVKTGDLWKIGSHYLVCGDSTNPKIYEKLYSFGHPVLCVTDPPYGVNYDPSWREKFDLGVGKRSKGLVINDEIIDWSIVFGLVDVDVLYVWHASMFTNKVLESIEKENYEIICQIIWNKQHFVLSRGDYHWKHEPCFYTVKKGKTHNWQGARDQTTVWEIANNNSFGNANCEKKYGHGTQKPIECMARPIQNNSAVGECVIDPFVGSGTTLIACEKLHRRGMGIEISEEYCSSILERFSVEFPTLKIEKIGTL